MGGGRYLRARRRISARMALLFQYMLRGALVATAFAVFVQFAAGYALLQASAGGKRSRVHAGQQV